MEGLAGAVCKGPGAGQKEGECVRLGADRGKLGGGLGNIFAR